MVFVKLEEMALDGVKSEEDDYSKLQNGLDLSLKVIEELADLEIEKEHTEVSAEGGADSSSNLEASGYDSLLEPIQLGHDRVAKERSLDVQAVGRDAETTFEDLELKPDVIEGLKCCRFVEPSPIQFKAIPVGKFGIDLILQSKSGTGKTCAFGVIILENIDLSPDEAENIQAVIISPTRELAVQNKSVIKCIGLKMKGLKVKDFIGGTSVPQSIWRSKACNVVSGTPGRILHMASEGEMDLSHVQIVVLDEADRLMEASFLKDIVSIFDLLPSEKQVIAASATYTNELKDFVMNFMREPVEITTDSSPELLSVHLYAAEVFKILEVDIKGTVMTQLQVFEMKMKVVMQILQNVQYTQLIIFSRFVLLAEKIYQILKDLSFDVALLTGALSQEKRLASFREAQRGKIKILVASDLGSRGIDCEGVDLVINFELPDDPSTFIHRFGRAGRFGSAGSSISLLMFRNDYYKLSEYISKQNLDVRCLSSTKHIQDLGKSRGKLRKIFRKHEVASLDASGLENTKEMVKQIMTQPMQCPSLAFDAHFGLKMNLDSKNVAKRVAEIEALYNNFKIDDKSENQQVKK